MENDSIIKTKNLSKNYRLGKTTINAVKNINLDISKGDFLVLAGASGSGKTTLLNLVGLIDKPSAGEIVFGNMDLTQIKMNDLYHYRRDNLGYIFQSFNLLPVLNVYENVEYPLILTKVPPARRKKLTEEILERVGLIERKKHKPGELSGGERQRVSIARAVVKKPDIVLADEPTANLDSITGMEIINLMENLNMDEGITFVFSSHDPSIIIKGHRVIHLKDGQIDTTIYNEGESQ